MWSGGLEPGDQKCRLGTARAVCLFAAKVVAYLAGVRLLRRPGWVPVLGGRRVVPVHICWHERERGPCSGGIRAGASGQLAVSLIVRQDSRRFADSHRRGGSLLKVAPSGAIPAGASRIGSCAVS